MSVNIGKTGLFLCFYFLVSKQGLAQNDTIVLYNKNQIIGEVKGMDKSVLTIETDYSKADFKVKWEGINSISTNSSFIITLKDGNRLTGKIKTTDSSYVQILYVDGNSKKVNFESIVFLKPIKTGFIDRLHASADFGFSLTKAQNLKQISLRSAIGYMAENWIADLSFNTLFSNQDKTETIKRKDGGLTFNFLLPKDWYIPASVTFLSNSEQQLDLRLLEKIGVGNYIIHSNHSYWGVASGLTFNSEAYYNKPAKKSWEAYVGTELNFYNSGDLSMVTRLVAYPSLTESGRWRCDFNLDIKYDLPLNFYVKLGVTYNYDNRPVSGSSNSDYVMQSGIGWKL
jgi:hypothetical protein